jgi:hypothetical protein
LNIKVIDPVSGFCLGIVQASYERLAPRGRLLKTDHALAQRDALLLAWATSNDIFEIAKGAIDHRWGMSQSESLEAAVQFGQISGSIDARETILQQHLTVDLSLFVVNEVVPSKESLDRRKVVAWALKLARDEILKALDSKQYFGHHIHLLNERLAVQKSALSLPMLKDTALVKLGRSIPGEAAINNARRSKSGLHPKAGETLHIYEGLRRLAPFAVRRIVLQTLIERLSSQRLLELGGGLAMAEALSIASGYPLNWNFDVVTDGVMATVGPYAVGWHKPVNILPDHLQVAVSTKDTRTGLNISFIQCPIAPEAFYENETIRLATESLLALCRNESKKGPDYKETPLSNCAVVMCRLFEFRPLTSSPDQMIITEFGKMAQGLLLELAHRVCTKTPAT